MGLGFIPLSPFELSMMRAPNESSMQDTCVPMKRSVGATNSFGTIPETFNDQTPSPCGFDPRGGQETNENIRGQGSVQAEIIVTEASVRLPLAQEGNVSRHDRIRITHRFGVELTPHQTFSIVSNPQRGSTGLVCQLRKVEL